MCVCFVIVDCERQQVWCRIEFVVITYNSKKVRHKVFSVKPQNENFALFIFNFFLCILCYYKKYARWGVLIAKLHSTAEAFIIIFFHHLYFSCICLRRGLCVRAFLQTYTHVYVCVSGKCVRLKCLEYSLALKVDTYGMRVIV